ncbi:MAG: hypothetical protein ACYDA1_10365 [Vulcanimicrobiaceae bacterium]
MEDDLGVNVGWGRRSRNGIVGGKGKIVAWRDGERLTLDEDSLADAEGNIVLDVFINENVYWKNIPHTTWFHLIAGYQVLKKWLSYREESVLERKLLVDEVREFSDIARRITAILAMGSDLDKNYIAIKQKTYNFPTIEL